MTLLSVNLNKIAVLRNSRGEHEPDPLRACDCVIEAGAGGITVHPRPDQRHVRPGDVYALAERIAGRVEFNIEGNGFAPPRGDYPGLVELVRAVRPQQVTLVPDGDAQITSDHGFDLVADAEKLRPLIAQLRELGARVSLFVDAGCAEVERAAELGAQRVEIYTGPFAKAYAAGAVAAELARCVETAERARAAGLGVNAGHDLSQANLAALAQAIPFLAEVSIGHALIGEALYDGLAPTVRNYLQLLRRD
ncbi:pyridoxine 5'-phosphate synthase [Tahibacter harae]|uniref:Pyridoxine 5'-phosphate synthase n=1 Tax=Tahibacter harae TaxID=2963937 RepID=A0ABT1QXN9_9GAMM|nr:pyridoxine 5'-phosphate synthase [Tahibacter harae]MCQ4167038.1 pyridoxine 5'-phosphate synthase [Tahibacter harae]